MAKLRISEFSTQSSGCPLVNMALSSVSLLRLCPLCASAGIKSKVKVYKFNGNEEETVMCKNSQVLS